MTTTETRMYEVRSNAARQRVTLILSKDYSHDPEHLSRDLHAAVAAAKAGADSFDILVDMIDIPVMAQDRVGRGEALIDWCNANGLRRAAFAVSTMIQELQFKRISERNERFHYFRSHTDAERWLDAQFVDS